MSHQEEHFNAPEVVRDLVIGISDGLTVPFALAAGLSGASLDNSLVTIAGLSEIIAGSIAMGLGGYLSAQTEKEHYDSEVARELYEMDHFREKEIAEVHEIVEGMGLSPELAKQATSEIISDRKRWLDFMMKFELGLEAPSPGRALRSGLNIGIAYIAGGLIPLLPYVFLTDSRTSLYLSATLTCLSLFAFGWWKSKLTGNPPFKGAGRMLIVGACAAAFAYLAALWLKGI